MATYGFTDISWPDTLPPPCLKNTRVIFGNDFVERKTESGEKEIRRFGGHKPDIIHACFVFTQEQMKTFICFYEHDANLCSNYFYAPWAKKLGKHSMQKTSSYYYCRFAGYPKRKAYGTMYSTITIPILITIWPFRYFENVYYFEEKKEG